MDVFNNREIALGIWLVILFAWGAVMPSTRKAYYGVVKAFTRRLILIPLSLMAVYITFLVYGLHEAGLWDTGQLKNTIVWSVSVAAVSFFRIDRIADDPHYYWNAIRDNLKLVVVLEFVVAFYTFDLWAELLVVPFTLAIGGVLAIAQIDRKYDAVEKLGNVLALFGGGLVAFAFYYLFTDFGSFAKPNTLADFSLPPLLSLLYLPFLFVLALYVNYENVFTRMQFAIKNSSLRAFAKPQAIFGFHVHTGLLKRWARNLMLVRPESKQDIRDSIRKVKVLRARERNPEDVPYERGWSPYIAVEYLVTEGLQLSDYHRAVGGGDEWYASSLYLEIAGGIIPNNIAYYVEGNELTATTLKLVMNVNEPQASQDARQRFIEIARYLFVKALNNEMPPEIETHLSSEIDTTTLSNGKEVAVSKELCPKHRLDGYTLKFIIQNTTRL